MCNLFDILIFTEEEVDFYKKTRMITIQPCGIKKEENISPQFWTKISSANFYTSAAIQFNRPEIGNPFE